MELPKLIVTGHAGHGKDTFCELLRKHYNFQFVSSSIFTCEKVVLPVLGPKYGYKTVEECYLDRNSHRSEWFDLIAAYNEPDRSKLGKEIFKENDIYCGLRNINELIALRNERSFFASIWIDASDRLPPESGSSISIQPHDCALYISNNSSLEEFERRVILFGAELLQRYQAYKEHFLRSELQSDSELYND